MENGMIDHNLLIARPALRDHIAGASSSSRHFRRKTGRLVEAISNEPWPEIIAPRRPLSERFTAPLTLRAN
jgi:hypothetical protein